MSTYVVSDIHGQYDTFVKGLEDIGFSDSDKLYVIGDAIDRGPDGIKVLNHIRLNANMELIIGNHEFMMLNSITPDGKNFSGRDLTLWQYYNGGEITKNQFENMSEDERKELMVWLSSRYVIKTIEVDDRIFCLTHSFFLPECENKKYEELEYQQVWDTVWKSRFRYDDTHDYGYYYEYPYYTFITGHVPIQNAFNLGVSQLKDDDALSKIKNGNLVNIDGGCAKGSNKDAGMLFLRLEDMKLVCRSL